MTLSRINVSIGTAAVLGLADVPLGAAPTTAYLMLGGRCLMNCAFCAQARESEADILYLSRVTWPEFGLGETTERLSEAVKRGDIRRACVQVTVTADAFDRTLLLLDRVKVACDVPFDVAILPRNLDQVQQLLDAGTDHIGFGLDAACERVFRQVKGGSWKGSLRLIESTARAYPGRAAVHLIAGLGESEREMVERVQWAHDLGVTVGLFAFTPVPGTHLENLPAPSLGSYRRLQVARWLIAHDRDRSQEMSFDAKGRLLRLGVPIPEDGEPFRTSGCPDCNRPYYNERPGGPMYNYPRPLSPEEADRAIRELEFGA
jgi:biotin synthase-related radical SAM superfamily protein